MLRRLVLSGVVGVLIVSACEKNKPAPAVPPPAAMGAPDASGVAFVPGPPLGKEVRARVNGVPITGEELAFRLSGENFGPKGERATLAQQQKALDQAILAELEAQRAMDLHYEPEIPRNDGGMPEPVLLELRRHNLAKQYRLKELMTRSMPTYDEIRAYYAANTARVQSQFVVQVIAMPNKATGDAFVAAVNAGKSFDVVAQELYPSTPDPKPWAPVQLTFITVPPPFWPVLSTLAPGQVSGFIPDLGEYGWVIKLVERKLNTAYTVEQAEGAVSAFLQAQKFEERRKADEKALRAAAKIELYAPAP